MANDPGNFPFTGGQRSYSFPKFWADRIPNSTAGVQCPHMPCEQVYLRSHPDSTGNIILRGGPFSVGTGYTVGKGEVVGWIPINNLNLIWHQEADATTYLEYMIIPK